MGEPFTSTHIYHITDTTDHRARGKVDGAWTFHRGRLGVRDVGYTFLPAVDTVDIGITLSEMISNSQRPDRLIIAVNCAPADKAEGTVNNARRDFFCADLKDNVTVCGTSNGYELSYVKDLIQEFHRLTITNSKGSQFRSLEILPGNTLEFALPEHRAAMIEAKSLRELRDIDRIVRSPPRITHVHEVDNFQNVKLVPSNPDLRMMQRLEGRDVRFGFGDVSVETLARQARGQGEHPALVAPTLFAAPKGTNVLALSSSSKRLGRDAVNVPIIATIRDNPAKTDPNYPVPHVGAPVWLTPRMAA